MCYKQVSIVQWSNELCLNYKCVYPWGPLRNLAQKSEKLLVLYGFIEKVLIEYWLKNKNIQAFS